MAERGRCGIGLGSDDAPQVASAGLTASRQDATLRVPWAIRWGVAVGVVLVHIGVALWWWSTPPSLLAAPSRGQGLSVEVVSASRSAPAPSISASAIESPSTTARPSQASSTAQHQRTHSSAPSSSASTKPATAAQRPTPKRSSSPATPSKPALAGTAVRAAPAGVMLDQALADVHRQGWQDTSQDYAENGTAQTQAALTRYQQDWVRAVQHYVDLHFPATRRNTRLSFQVTLGRSGEVLALDVIHSTGDASLDALALANIRAAAPFRAFDPAMGRRQTLSFQQGWTFNQGAQLEF